MIPLYVLHGVAFVWNSNDWFRLRSEHRICGALIGTFAPKPRQNEFLGLPMTLMSEEAALLVEKGICELFETPDIKNKVSDELAKEIEEGEKKTVEEQRVELKKRRIETITQKIDIIVAGKKKKLISKGETNVEIDKEALLQEQIDKIPEITPGNILTYIPTEHHIPTEKKKVSIDVLTPSVQDEEGALRYLVFKDLWEQGYYITAGLKFGADFIVYPADPCKFHADYMVRCIPDVKMAFQPIHMVAFGRLAVSVNKMAVFAYRKSDNQVGYQTLQWHDSLH